MNRKQIIVLSTVAVFALIGTAVASAFITKETLTEDKVMPQKVATKQETKRARPVQVASNGDTTPWRNQQPAQAAQPACDDGNVLGYVAGGAAGALVGSQIGKGSGNTAAIIGGTLGGAYLGGEHLSLRNTLCR